MEHLTWSSIYKIDIKGASVAERLGRAWGSAALVPCRGLQGAPFEVLRAD